MPKFNKKRNNHYSKLARFLKDKVDFNIDLRKTENSMSPAMKGTLTKAYNELQAYQNLNLVPLNRERGESKKAFKARKAQTKKDLGQRGSFFAGVFIDTPNYTQVKTKRVKTDNGRWSTQIISEAINKDGEPWQEIYIPVGNGLEFAKNPNKILDDLRAQYKDEFDCINPNHSGFRGMGGDLKDDTLYNHFKTQLRKWANEYAPVVEHRKNERWLSGFYVSSYIRQTDVSPKKRFKKTNKKGRNA